MTYFERIARANSRKTQYGISGLSYYDLLNQADLQSCNSRDSACVANNEAKQAAVEDYWINNGMKSSSGVPDGTVLTFQPLSDSQVKEFYDGTNVLNGGNVVDTKNVLSVNGTTYNAKAVAGAGVTNKVAASISFLNLTTGGISNGQFKVGDKWRISIANCDPNQPVIVEGVQNGVSLGKSQLGTTNGNGSYTLDGQMTSDNIGSWKESWYVPPAANSNQGLVQILSFSVAQVQSQTTSANPNQNATNTTNTTITPAMSVDIPSWFTDSMFGGVPNWALVAGGVMVIGMMFGGKR